MKIAAFSLFLLTSVICFGQTETNEVLWTGLGTKIKFNKKIRLDLEQQVRFQNEFKNYAYTFTEFGLNYKPTTKIRLAGNYRYMTYERGIRHRYALEAHYTFKPKNSYFYFHIRERFQAFIWQDNNSSTSNIRNLITVGYKAAKLVRIYTTQEWFYRLDNINTLTSYRGTAGINWNISTAITLMTYYSYQKSINSTFKKNTHIIGLRGFYKINLSKKGKK